MEFIRRQIAENVLRLSTVPGVLVSVHSERYRPDKRAVYLVINLLDMDVGQIRLKRNISLVYKKWPKATGDLKKPGESSTENLKIKFGLERQVTAENTCVHVRISWSGKACACEGVPVFQYQICRYLHWDAAR